MLYLIKSGEYIKVGFSKDVISLKRRMRNYKTMNPNVLLLGLCEGTEEDEVNYHIKLDAYKLYNRAEWFKQEALPLIVDDFKSGEMVDEFNSYFNKRVTNKSGEIRGGSYQQIIKDYYEDFNPEYELEYPEFKEYKKYLTLNNLNTLNWNKDKALKAIETKKEIISKIIKLECGKFYTNAEIKKIIGAKATLVKDYFNCTETKVDGKNGYRLENKINTNYFWIYKKN